MSGGPGTTVRAADASGTLAPLRLARFRTLWLASLLSNLGLMVQSVGASWVMTQKTDDASLVAMVQTAALLPMLVFTLPAGAIADVYERRKVAAAALGMAILGSAVLFSVSLAGALTRQTILAFIFLTGCGMAFYWPCWQSGLADQVPTEMLPAAVGLNSMSYNGARVVGPAVGGAVVAAGGATVTFGLSLLLYIPMLIAQLASRTRRDPATLPPESLGRAIVSGLRYVAYTADVRVIVLRVFVFTACGGAGLALMPLVARDLIGAGAGVYGIFLAAFGVGAIIGVFAARPLRDRWGAEGSTRAGAALLGASLIVVALSTSMPLTGAALVVGGLAWMMVTQTCNVGLQMLSPRWVSGRTVAAFQTSLSGGMALAGVGWGIVAEQWGVVAALGAAGLLLVLSVAMGVAWPLRDFRTVDPRPGERIAEPEVGLRLGGRSGPIIVEIEYRVSDSDIDGFASLFEDVQQIRQRNGAYAISIARDLGDPERWVERYEFPTWHDYLRHRDRMTEQERELHRRLMRYHLDDQALRVRRLLARPFDQPS